MLLLLGNNVSVGEIGGGWKGCEVILPWLGDDGEDDEEKLFRPVDDGGELHVCGVKDDGGRGVCSGERWETGLLTRLLGSIWGGGGPSEPSCIDKKYFVAACRSCSLSSAVWRLKMKLEVVSRRNLTNFSPFVYNYFTLEYSNPNLTQLN